MPRKPRFFLPEIPIHIVVRGNNKQIIFAEEDDFQAYINAMAESLIATETKLHAYVLMSNHVHLLVSAMIPENISKLIQGIGRKYVPYFNHKYGRTGTIWEGRFKASSIDSDQYMLACYRYIEMNPVRAKMVNAPADYKWSSYGGNALGHPSKVLSPHDLYLALGKTEASRQAAYRSLFSDVMNHAVLQDIRDCLQTGTPLGNDKFRLNIEALLGQKVGSTQRGRPLSLRKLNK